MKKIHFATLTAAVLTVMSGTLSAGSRLTSPQVTLDARSLGVTGRWRVLPAHIATPDDPLEMGHPAMVRVALGPQDPMRQEAALSVVPLAGLLASNAGESARQLRAQLTRLRTLIDTRPATYRGELPYLLEPDAAQLFASRGRPLDFAGGHGLRYLTMYSSDVSPVTSDRVFYTFQGLTSDGRYAVVLTYPVSVSLLPNTYSAVPRAQQEALAQGTGYAAYLARTVRALTDADPAAFAPKLEALDAVVRSVRVRP